MFENLKSLARKSTPSIVAYRIWDNWRIRTRFRAGNIETEHGSTHSTKTVSQSLDYINAQFADYLRYSGLHEDQLYGARVLEIGSGDNIGLALRFLAAGAARVVCLDKFYSKRNLDQQRHIYLTMREQLVAHQRQRFDEAITVDAGLETNPEKLRCVYGQALEDSVLVVEERPFDLIVSRAVIEEMYDPDAMFKATDKLLAPGGYILHKIDLSDYGIFSGGGLHPLTFLTIPDVIYRMMASDSGIPNRRLINYYRDKVRELGYESRLLVTSIIGKGSLEPHKERVQLGIDYCESTLALVDEIRPKLRERYRRMPDEDLLIDGIFLVGTKATQ